MGKWDKQRLNRLYEIRTMNCGEDAQIIEYYDSQNCTVQFLDEYKAIIHNVCYGNFVKGTIKNPYHKNVYGAYVGVGKYKISENKNPTYIYDAWSKMLSRCTKKTKYNKTYFDVSCCEEWMNFQYFAEWYEKHYYKVDGYAMELDKDWIKYNNRVYCPEYCCILPSIINSCILSHDKLKYQELPTGITYHNNMYCARVSEYGKRKVIFHSRDLKETMNFYMNEKIRYIKELANKYKGIIPDIVYKNMINYKERFLLDNPRYMILFKDGECS